MRVLILCTGNSARSQMAEGLLRSLSGGAIDVHSAGTHPQPTVHPTAVETMRRRFGLDITAQGPKSVDGFAGQPFDYVITVCDAAAETCPKFPGHVEHLHWGFPDPAAVPGDEASRRAFDAVAVEMATRLRLWLTVLGKPASGPATDPVTSSTDPRP